MKYMVFVEGTQAPTVIHPTYGSAAIEAERLAQLTPNRNRHVRVVLLISTLEPVNSHQWALCDDEEPTEP
jgi:hypothetical protein